MFPDFVCSHVQGRALEGALSRLGETVEDPEALEKEVERLKERSGSLKGQLQTLNAVHQSLRYVLGVLSPLRTFHHGSLRYVLGVLSPLRTFHHGSLRYAHGLLRTFHHIS